MRDNSEQLPQILRVMEVDGSYFCVVELRNFGAEKRFKFGVSRHAYEAVLKILHTRPFDQMPGVQYQYYFVPAVAKLENGMASLSIRIEQGSNGKEFHFTTPKELAANLLWFFQLKNLEDVSHLASLS